MEISQDEGKAVEWLASCRSSGKKAPVIIISVLIMGHLSFLGERELHPSDSAFFSSSSVIPRSLIRKGRLQEDLHVVFCHGEGAHSCKQGLLVLAEGGEKRAVRV